jgi:hypothetical protein
MYAMSMTTNPIVLVDRAQVEEFMAVNKRDGHYFNAEGRPVLRCRICHRQHRLDSVVMVYGRHRSRAYDMKNMLPYYHGRSGKSGARDQPAPPAPEPFQLLGVRCPRNDGVGVMAEVTRTGGNCVFPAEMTDNTMDTFRLCVRSV